MKSIISFIAVFVVLVSPELVFAQCGQQPQTRASRRYERPDRTSVNTRTGGSINLPGRLGRVYRDVNRRVDQYRYGQQGCDDPQAQTTTRPGAWRNSVILGGAGAGAGAGIGVLINRDDPKKGAAWGAAIGGAAGAAMGYFGTPKQQSNQLAVGTAAARGQVVIENTTLHNVDIYDGNVLLGPLGPGESVPVGRAANFFQAKIRVLSPNGVEEDVWMALQPADATTWGVPNPQTGTLPPKIVQPVPQEEQVQPKSTRRPTSNRQPRIPVRMRQNVS